MRSVSIRAPLQSRKFRANRPPGPSPRPVWLPRSTNKETCPAVSSGNSRRAGVCQKWRVRTPNIPSIYSKMGLHERGIRCHSSTNARRNPATRFPCDVASAYSLGHQARGRIINASHPICETFREESWAGFVPQAVSKSTLPTKSGCCISLRARW